MCTEWAVSLVPVPAITGMSTASMTAANSDESLVVGEHRRLAGGAGDDEAVVAVVLQVAGQRAGDVEIERAVVVERRDHRREHTAETRHQNDPSAERSMPWVRMRSSCSSIHTSW